MYQSALSLLALPVMLASYFRWERRVVDQLSSLPQRHSPSELAFLLETIEVYIELARRTQAFYSPFVGALGSPYVLAAERDFRETIDALERSLQLVAMVDTPDHRQDVAEAFWCCVVTGMFAQSIASAHLRDSLGIAHESISHALTAHIASTNALWLHWYHSTHGTYHTGHILECTLWCVRRWKDTGRRDLRWMQLKSPRPLAAGAQTPLPRE